MVGKHIGIGPDQAQATVIQIVGNRAIAQDVGGRQRVRGWGFFGPGPVVKLTAQRLIGLAAAGDGVNRVNRIGVPVAVEQLLRWPDDEADGEGVNIDEVLAGAAQKILVGHVAPANHSHGAVGNEQLVVHAVVNPFPVAHRRQEARGRAQFSQTAKGVEQAYLHILVGRKREEQIVLAAGVEIVDQQPHAHAAIRGVAQRTQQPAPGFVVFEVVVLHVQRHLGAPRQLDAGVE